MNAWLEHTLERAESIQDGLSLKRQQSLLQLKSTEFPGRKQERWKYTSVKALEQLTLNQDAANVEFNAAAIEGLETLDLVFVNGELKDLPKDNILPTGLQIFRLNDESRQADLNQLFDSVKPSHHYFGLVNDVLASDGVMIDVDSGACIEKPIRIINVLSQGADAHSRVLVRLGEKSTLSLIEQSEGNEAGINTLFCEYQLGSHSVLNHYRFALQSREAIALGGHHFSLADHATLHSSLVAFGSQLSRLDVDIDHNGERAQANLNAIYLLDNQELFDLHATVEHRVANGETNENIRGIVGGSAKAVFNGRIHIHPDAQKTEAKLNNRNLLLSNRAEVDTKPELEIYADDVRCAHGATVAQIDTKSLYYMQSRGIDKKQAQAMLNFGFINELIEMMRHPEIAEWLRPQIRQRFEQMAIEGDVKE